MNFLSLILGYNYRERFFLSELYRTVYILQGLNKLEKYLNIQDCLEKSLKIKFALKSTGKTIKGFETSLKFYHLHLQENSTLYFET